MRWAVIEGRLPPMKPTATTPPLMAAGLWVWVCWDGVEEEEEREGEDGGGEGRVRTRTEGEFGGLGLATSMNEI